jgi:hypothetical protein
VEPGWPDGPQGATGSQGPKGAAGDPGIGLSWRGQYQSGQSYALNDVVQLGGSAYVARATVAATSCSGACIDSNAPGVSSSWQLLASGGAKGDAGPQGTPGVAGLQGPAGPAGAGLAGYEIVDTGFLLVGPLGSARDTALCTPGKRVISGGVQGSLFVHVTTSIPDSTNWTGWIGGVANTDIIPLHYKVYAICVDL